jgi:ABC-type nitrate/sulfonate/bicarbonate transport system substrate-binding protein
MNTRSSWMNAFIGAAIMIISAGCAAANGATPAGAAPPPEEADVTVAAIPAVDLAGLYIAQDRGLFAEQGLHVRIEPIPSAQSVIADQLKGKVDITAGSYVAYLAAQRYGEQVLADLDQGAVINLPVDGYVATGPGHSGTPGRRPRLSGRSSRGRRSPTTTSPPSRPSWRRTTSSRPR